MPVLAAAFFVTAILYASVGFGGGSTYSALLALAGADYLLLPVVALLCNLVVVAGSTVRFARAGVTPWRGALGLVSLGAPAALLGGLTPIGEQAFFTVLGASLVLAGLALFLPTAGRDDEPARAARFAWLAAAPLGYLAGLVGIGGGIFLAPLLHLVRWREARAIAATASLFILVNSLFGLAGQLLKSGSGLLGAAAEFGLLLIIAVVIGGQIGSLLAVRFMPKRVIRMATAALTILVGGRLLLAI
ncbi:sulfite exporter TauE/SafE family protein [Alteriqipengyuania flavescens]|uniref:sulfite exporter TauE/SafE family protein n=1 Tax=Alteriqipengyuania flavescens TaxID=3053610 RepID=UPI0025B573D0|nr:sulfite exporter TauE/SafE family protein [Alteriqipengyuania flavescens]WJY18498.1 sulfite exporter TauE/SafE family protein [Alteriqipengyuania flavescens]WJY24438.1 sulfite exporter TauE/SafE family protein [Alteriqipengyuania flavescens]